MALQYVTLILDGFDGSGTQLTRGTATFTPSVQLTDPADQEWIPPAPVAVEFRKGLALPQVTLLATDNANVLPAGWGWKVSFLNVPGSPAPFSFFLPFAGGATQRLSQLQPVQSVVTMAAYMPLPSGTPNAGQVPISTGNGEASAWTTLISPQAFASPIAAPVYSAHRAGGSVQGGGFYQGPYPEEFLEGYRAAVAAGATCLNPHVRMLADGALVLMHDSTPDRTTNATGSVPVADYNTVNWRQLTGTPQTWTGQYGVNWGTIYPPLWEDFVREFGGKVMLVIEAESAAWQSPGTAATALTKSLQAHGLTNCAIISSFIPAELTYPAANGVQTLYYPPNYGTAGYDAASIAAAMASGWAAGQPKHVGINAFGSTKANIQAYIPTLTAAGFTVWGWTLARRSDVAWLQAAGCTGFFTDEPIYNAATGPVNVSGKDPTSISAVWPHGLLLADLSEGRGNITHGGVQLDFTSTSGQQWCCYGSLCPVVNAASTYTVVSSITYDTLDSDTSRWAGLYICCPDDSVTSGIIGTGTGLVNGYTIILRITGQLAVFRNNGGGTQSQVGSNQSTQAITAGQVATLSVQVTPTQIIITPTINGTGYGPFAFTDSTYRGGYFHIGKAMSAGTKLIVTHKSVTAA